MKLGFDYDGVICDIDITKLRILDSMPPSAGVESAKMYYYYERQVIRNPADYLADGDEFYIVSFREKGFWGVGREWLQRNGIRPKEVVFVGEKNPYTGITDQAELRIKDTEVAKLKAEVINKLELDVYFDDNPGIVEDLRKLCSKTLVIQVGRRRVA